jgi:hypothetical protein
VVPEVVAPEVVAPDLFASGQEADPAQPSLEWNLLRDLWVQPDRVQPDPGHGLRDRLG